MPVSYAENSIVCLCGSTRYLEDFGTANRELSKLGFMVTSISMALPKEGVSSEDAALKEVLDLVHLNKILHSHVVFIVGPGYFGFSTAREILWAQMQGKPVVSWSACHGDWRVAASAIRSGSHGTDIYPRAREILAKGR